MKGIITVIGKDKIGIIARVCTFLAERRVNVVDVSQNIVQGYFNMMMIVDFAAASIKFEDAAEGLEKLGEEIGVRIQLQHEDIFNSMHRI